MADKKLVQELKFSNTDDFKRAIADLPEAAVAGSNCHMIRSGGEIRCVGRCGPGMQCKLVILEDTPTLVVRCSCAGPGEATQ